MPLLYTPPIPQSKCSMDGWKYGMELMDSPPFYHQLQECKGLQTPGNVPGNLSIVGVLLTLDASSTITA